MPLSMLNRCVFNPVAGGTTDFAVSTAVTGYLTPAQAGAQNGFAYHYVAQSANLQQWEIGIGTYSTSGPTLARSTVILSSNSNSKVNFTSAPQVFITATAEDFGAFAPSGSGHLSGMVPDPGSTAGISRVLLENSTWGIPPVQGWLSGLNTYNNADNQVWIKPGIAGSADGTYMLKQGGPGDVAKTISSAWSSGFTAGAGSLDTGSIASNTWYFGYIIARLDTGAIDFLTSLAPDIQNLGVTISTGTPGVINWPLHGLQDGAPVIFSTTGALPTGMSPSTTYFVKSPTLNNFNIALTQGGAAMNLSGTQNGTHSVFSVPLMPANYSQRRLITAFKTATAPNLWPFQQNGDEFLYTILPTLDLNANSIPSSRTLQKLAFAPPGFPTDAIITANANSESGVQATAASFYSTLTPDHDLTSVPADIQGPPNTTGSTSKRVLTDTSQQIAMKSVGGSTLGGLQTFGFVWRRGKL